MIEQIMTLEDVARWVEGVRRMARDNEAAHGREDDCWKKTLRFIASGDCPDPVAFAAAALRTLEIDYVRWYA